MTRPGILLLALITSLLIPEWTSRAELAGATPDATVVATVLVSRPFRFSPVPNSLAFLSTVEKGESIVIIKAASAPMVYVKLSSEPQIEGWTELTGLDLTQSPYVQDFRDYHAGLRALVADKADLEAAQPEGAPSTIEPGSVVEITGARLKRSLTLQEFPVRVIAVPDQSDGMAPVGTRGWIDLKELRYIPSLQPRPTDPNEEITRTPEEEKAHRTLLITKKGVLEAQYQRNRKALQKQYGDSSQDHETESGKEFGVYRAKFTASSHDLSAKYDQDIGALQKSYNQSMQDRRTQYDQDLTAIRTAYSKKTEELKTKYDQDSTALRATLDKDDRDLAAKRNQSLAAIESHQKEASYYSERQVILDQADKDAAVPLAAYITNKKASDEKFGAANTENQAAFAGKKKILDDQYQKDYEAIRAPFAKKSQEIKDQYKKDSDNLKEPFDKKLKELTDQYNLAKKGIDDLFKGKIDGLDAQYHKEMDEMSALISRSEQTEKAMLPGKVKSK